MAGRSTESLAIMIEGLWIALFGALGTATFGGVIVCGGLLLLGEYRSAFFRDPRSMMTLELFARAGGGAGPGYLAMWLLLVGGLIMLAGVTSVIAVAGISVFELISSAVRHDG